MYLDEIIFKIEIYPRINHLLLSHFVKNNKVSTSFCFFLVFGFSFLVYGSIRIIKLCISKNRYIKWIYNKNAEKCATCYLVRDLKIKKPTIINI